MGVLLHDTKAVLAALMASSRSEMAEHGNSVKDVPSEGEFTVNTLSDFIVVKLPLIKFLILSYFM